MGRYVTVSQEVDVEIDMEDFDTDELVEELQRRGKSGSTIDGESPMQLLQKIYLKRRTGQDYEQDLDNLIYESLGRLA
jgi:hypothetical protein